MRTTLLNTFIMTGIAVVFIMIFSPTIGGCMDESKSENVIALLPARIDSETSIESTMMKRRSIRRYTDEPLTLYDVSQLLWAAQGITNSRGFRTSPSAGALYPLEIYVIAGNVINFPAGIYKYKPIRHHLVKVAEGDKRAALSRASLNQSSIKNAPIVLVFCAVYWRTTAKYGQRGKRYVFMEIGHSAQNVCLQVVSLGLGTVTIGAFHDDKVKKIVNSQTEEEPLYIMPIGKLINR
ncbi:MAG: SagB/ThcOx family dehydrogenase [Desulfobacterales bacterium]|nr:MAG: SagB/ThcOx family dehydrogenase [Desulfobacterales bacterium]UCD89725.1 MAG: SagB/ThcOx family dehydrogenase [Desulfobacterales bacterium]